jgi:hypothetical protein
LSQPNDDAARALLGGDQAIRCRGADDAERVRSSDLFQRGFDRLVEATGAAQVVLDQMGEDLGIGFRLEPVPVGQEADP